MDQTMEFEYDDIVEAYTKAEEYTLKGYEVTKPRLITGKYCITVQS